MRLVFPAAVLTACLLAPTGDTGALEPDQAQKAAETRQAVLKLVGWNVGPLADMVRADIEWDQALFARNAQRIAWTTTMIPDAFRAETSQFDLDTEALPDIWQDFGRFEELAGNVQRSSARLAEIARAGDREATVEAFVTMVDDCKACHDRFREQDR
jgi:cytochrome c556